MVADFKSEKYSVPELWPLHNIYRWIYEFPDFNEKGFRVVEMKDSSYAKIKEMEARMKVSEAALGRNKSR
ncbi:hypothetical protein [Salegentibacter sp. F14]